VVVRCRAMSFRFGYLQRFPAFLIHTSMQGVGTLFQRVGPLPKLNLAYSPCVLVSYSKLRKLSVARMRPTKLT
jgi:hypothetical protein